MMSLLLCVADICREAKLNVSVSMPMLQKSGRKAGLCTDFSTNLGAPKSEDRTQEETLQQERCARREAWDLAKHVY